MSRGLGAAVEPRQSGVAVALRADDVSDGARHRVDVVAVSGEIGRRRDYAWTCTPLGYLPPAQCTALASDVLIVDRHGRNAVCTDSCGHWSAVKPVKAGQC